MPLLLPRKPRSIAQDVIISNLDATGWYAFRPICVRPPGAPPIRYIHTETMCRIIFSALLIAPFIATAQEPARPCESLRALALPDTTIESALVEGDLCRVTAAVT